MRIILNLTKSCSSVQGQKEDLKEVHLLELRRSTFTFIGAGCVETSNAWYMRHHCSWWSKLDDRYNHTVDAVSYYLSMVDATLADGVGHSGVGGK